MQKLNELINIEYDKPVSAFLGIRTAARLKGFTDIL